MDTEELDRHARSFPLAEALRRHRADGMDKEDQLVFAWGATRAALSLNENFRAAGPAADHAAADRSLMLTLCTLAAVAGKSVAEMDQLFATIDNRARDRAGRN